LTAHEFSAGGLGTHFLFDLEPDIPKAEYITTERKGLTEDDTGHFDLFVQYTLTRADRQTPIRKTAPDDDEA